jgi:hypothetical protein
MYHSALKGTYYEMGYQQGRALKRGGFTLPPPEKKRLQFARRCEDVVSRCMPELVEELHGVVDGSEISYDAIMTLTMTAPFEDNEIPRCSIVAVMPGSSVETTTCSMTYRKKMLQRIARILRGTMPA